MLWGPQPFRSVPSGFPFEVREPFWNAAGIPKCFSTGRMETGWNGERGAPRHRARGTVATGFSKRARETGGNGSYGHAPAGERTSVPKWFPKRTASVSRIRPRGSRGFDPPRLPRAPEIPEAVRNGPSRTLRGAPSPRGSPTPRPPTWSSPGNRPARTLWMSRNGRTSGSEQSDDHPACGQDVLGRPVSEQIADPVCQEGSRSLVPPEQGVKRELHPSGELRHAPQRRAQLTSLDAPHAVHRETRSGGQLTLGQLSFLPELADVAAEPSRVVQVQPPGKQGRGGTEARADLRSARGMPGKRCPSVDAA